MAAAATAARTRERQGNLETLLTRSDHAVGIAELSAPNEEVVIRECGCWLTPRPSLMPASVTVQRARLYT